MKNDFNNTSSEEQEQATSSDYDTIFGSLLFDCFCGGALGELAAEAMNVPEMARELDWGNAMELYEEYRHDRTNGNFRLGVNGSINGTFNRLGITFFENEDNPILIAAKGQGSYVTAPAPTLH